MAATVTVDKDGWFANDASIRREPRPTIEHGAMKSVRGIIVHQTGSSTAAGTLSSYKNAGANGAHFLIDKDGKLIHRFRSQTTPLDPKITQYFN